MSSENIDILLERLHVIEATLTSLVDQRSAKDWYTTAEIGQILGKSDYTVREWCRKGQAEAVKSPNGRGWLISRDELARLRNEGPIPEQQVHGVVHR
jgi:excisionase family DNA binding protein